jgi:Cd2+/Zn2+-exporting ATPase
MTNDVATKTQYRVGGMDCASCGAKVQNAVNRLEGVSGVEVSVSSGIMKVSHTGPAPSAAINQIVRWLGYTIAPADVARPPSKNPAEHEEGHGHSHLELGEGAWWKSQKAILTAASGIALAAAYVIGQLVPTIGHWVFLVAMLVGLIPIARRAVAAAITGTPFTIETLMAIAAIGAVFIGATEEAAMVVLLFLIGELLEGVAARKARASIQGLASLVPKLALLEKDGTTTEVAAASLAVGATILVRPGDRIPADGQIIEGASSIDEAPVTGESVPRRRGPGETVFAGTINTDAVLRVRVTASADDNTIARVIKLVEEAQESKAPTERFIDRFSAIYTPRVLVVGALVAIVPPLLFGASWSEWVYKGLAVLLIGCPCALVISTPAAIAAGLSAGARRGLLLKAGLFSNNCARSTRSRSTRQAR